MNVIQMVIFLFILFFSVIVHEFCHGYMAYLNGDDTAYMLGRLTFNPIPHIDPVGTILLPLILVLTRAPIMIGWAKPVPINPYKFRDHDRGMLTVGLAGPASNIIMGTVLAVISRYFYQGFVKEIFFFGAIINFVLAFFNLIPIPPLDGSRVLSVFLRGNIRYQYERLERYGLILVFVFLFLFRGILIIYPMAYRIVSALAGS